MIENIFTEWFNSDALRLPNYKVGRINYGLGRSYVKLGENGVSERVYASLTTAIGSCEPTGHQLLEWYAGLGMEEAKRKTYEAQNYGTFMHEQIYLFLKEMSYDFETIIERIEEYCSRNNYTGSTSDWEIKIKNDLTSFIQFFIDFDVKPLGIEFVALSDDYGFGTAIDIVANITVKVDGLDYDNPYKSGPRKGEPREVKEDKEIRAIINLKSGRKGFYRSNEIQSQCELLLWNENFPDIPVERCYNWSPKEWRGWPTYNFTDQTGKTSEEEIRAIMTLANIRHTSKIEDKKFVSVFGTFSVAGSLKDVVRVESADEVLKKKYSNEPVSNSVKARDVKKEYKSTELPF